MKPRSHKAEATANPADPWLWYAAYLEGIEAKAAGVPICQNPYTISENCCCYWYAGRLTTDTIPEA